MLYHGYRITFVGYDQDAAVFLISRRHSDEILAKTSTASKAVHLIKEWEKQTELPLVDRMASACADILKRVQEG